MLEADKIFHWEQIECAENGMLDGINNSQTKIDPAIIVDKVSKESWQH